MCRTRSHQETHRIPVSPDSPASPALYFRTITPCFSSGQSTQPPGSPTMPCPSMVSPGPYRGLCTRVVPSSMSPRTQLTWPLPGPPPWCTSPPRSGPGPASWGLCCTRGGCGPEGRKQQAVTNLGLPGASWMRDRSSQGALIPFSQGGPIRSPSHPLSVGMGTLGHCPAPAPVLPQQGGCPQPEG